MSRIRALVSFPIRPEPEWFTEPACVSLELAAELKQSIGYMILVDPMDEFEAAAEDRIERAIEQNAKRKRKWFEMMD